MKPSEVSARLRAIGSGIDAARRPSVHLVSEGLRRILAAVQGAAYLLFTSAGGSKLWTLPPGSDTVALKRAADAYNDTAAWQARGGDGTAYVFTDAELLEHFGEDNEVESIEDVYGMVEGHGEADGQKAMDMLTGKLDGLTGEPAS